MKKNMFCKTKPSKCEWSGDCVHNTHPQSPTVATKISSNDILFFNFVLCTMCKNILSALTIRRIQ